MPAALSDPQAIPGHNRVDGRPAYKCASHPTILPCASSLSKFGYFDVAQGSSVIDMFSHALANCWGRVITSVESFPHTDSADSLYVLVSPAAIFSEACAALAFDHLAPETLCTPDGLHNASKLSFTHRNLKQPWLLLKQLSLCL